MILDDIISGISKSIGLEFGEDYEIYTEDIEQGLNEPCFSIRLLNPTNNRFLGKRYKRTNQFCIHYFPKTRNVQSECRKVAERLFNCLEFITVGDGMIMGNSLNFEISDGVLHFFVNYDLFTYRKEEPIDYMENITHETDLKG